MLITPHSNYFHNKACWPVKKQWFLFTQGKEQVDKPFNRKLRRRILSAVQISILFCNPMKERKTHTHASTNFAKIWLSSSSSSSIETVLYEQNSANILTGIRTSLFITSLVPVTSWTYLFFSQKKMVTF